MKKIIKFNRKSFLIIIFLVLILIFGLAIYQTMQNQITNLEKQFNFIKHEYNTNPIFSSNQVIPIKNGFATVTLNSQSNELILTKNDLFNPTYTVLVDYRKSEKVSQDYQSVYIIYLKRVSWDKFQISSFRSNRINNLPITEALDLVSKYDITTDFPGKDKYDIVNYPPLSQEEIDKNRQRFEADEQKTKEVIAERTEILKKYNYFITKFQQTRGLQGILFEPDTKNFGYFIEIPNPNMTQEQIQANKPKVIQEYSDLISLLKAVQTRLNNDQNYLLPDGINLIPDQQTKKEINQYLQEIERVSAEVEKKN